MLRDEASLFISKTQYLGGHPQGIDIGRIYLAILKTAGFQKSLHQMSCCSLVGTSFAYIGVAHSVGLREILYLIPVGWWLYTYEARITHLLVGPECVAYPIFFQHGAESSLPLIGIMSRFAHIHRQVHTVSKLNKRADSLLGRLIAITMAGVH